MTRNEYLREMTLNEAEAAVAASTLAEAEQERYRQFALRSSEENIAALARPVYRSPGARLAGLAQVQEYQWQETAQGTRLEIVQTLRAQR